VKTVPIKVISGIMAVITGKIKVVLC